MRPVARSEATIRLHCRNAKSIFAAAVERELVPTNPFRKLPSRAIAGTRDRYITPAEAKKILDACPGLPWRTLFGLARLAGLRVPSETHQLTWADVDWDRGRLTVRSPKTEHHPGHDRRIVPTVPQLASILQDAFDAAEPGDKRIVTLSRNNMHRTFDAIVARAGLQPFNRPYQVLRQSCETEWAGTFPGHVVAAWLGHSEAVSRKHYLMVTDAEFDRATKPAVNSDSASAAISAASEPENDAKSAAAGSCNGMQASEAPQTDTYENSDKSSENRVFVPSSGTGPGGIRTLDQAIMSRLL